MFQILNFKNSNFCVECHRKPLERVPLEKKRNTLWALFFPNAFSSLAITEPPG